MLRIFIFTLFVPLFLSACAQKRPGEKKPTLASNLVNVTENEYAGIQDILAFYAGECKYGISVTLSTNNGTSKSFWLELRSSPVVDSLTITPDLIGSNIAFLFFRKLKEERDKYAEIQVKFKHRDGEELSFVYPTPTLQKVIERRKVVELIYRNLKNRDFNSLATHIHVNPVFATIPNQELITSISNAEKNFGEIRELVPYGFRILSPGDGNEYFLFASVLARDGDDTKLSVVLNSNTNDEVLHYFNYKF